MPVPVGIAAVLNLAEFTPYVKILVGGLFAINKSIADLNNANLEKIEKSVGNMGKTISTQVQAAVAKLVGAVQTLAKTSLQKLLGEFQSMLWVIRAVFVADVFRAFKRGLREVGELAWEAAGQFQTLQIRLEGLVGRDFARAFGGSVADAMSSVEGQVRSLMNWIRRLAVTTPFSVQSLANAVSMANSYGFTTTKLKKLIVSVGNFTAGMGLTDDHLTRIIYNFGQMISSTRIMGRDLRDLATSFVPVNTIIQKLADTAGVSFSEVRKQMEEGIVTGMDFINTFSQMADKDFPESMERMSRTLPGVIQNIKDFISTAFGLELLGPLVDKLGVKFSEALDKLFQPEMLRVFSAAGHTIAIAFDEIYQALINDLIPAMQIFLTYLGLAAPTTLDVARAVLTVVHFVRNLIQFLARGITAFQEFLAPDKTFENFFKILSSKTFGWGIDFTMSFAQGIVTGASGVISALSFLTRVLTEWLKPGSPPKFLPELAAWGQAAAQVYLDGWVGVDFGPLEALIGTFRSFLRSTAIDEIALAASGDIAIASLEQLKVVIIAFGETGDVAKDAFEDLSDKIGEASNLFARYTRNTVLLTKATNTLTMVQRALSFTGEQTVVVFGEAIQNVQNLIDVSERFNSRLLPIMRDYAIITGQVTKAQDELNDTTRYYDDILQSLENQLGDNRKVFEENTRLQEIEQALTTLRLTDEERTTLELEKRDIILQRQIRQTKVERGVAIASAKNKLKAAKDEQMALKNAALSIAKTEQDILSSRVTGEKSLLDILIAQNEIRKQMIRTIEGEKTDLEFMGFEFDPSSFDDLGADLDASLQETIVGLSEIIGREMDDMWAEFTASLPSFEELFGTFFEDWNKFGEDIEKLDLFGNIDELVADIVESDWYTKISGAWDEFVEDLKEAWGNLLEFWELYGPDITRLLKEIAGIASEALLGVGVDTTGSLLDIVGELIVGLSEKLLASGPNIISFLEDFSETLTEDIIPALNDFTDWLETDGGELFEKFITILLENLPTILKVVGAIFLLRKAFTVSPLLTTAIGSVATAMFFLLTPFILVGLAMKNFEKQLKRLDEYPDILGSLIEIISDGLDSILDLFTEFAKELLRSFIEGMFALGEWFDDWMQVWIDGISNNEPKMYDVTGSLIQQIGRAILNFAGEQLWEFIMFIDRLIKIFGEYQETFKQMGRNLMLGILQGIYDKAYLILDFLRELIFQALDLVAQITGSRSPSKKFATLSSDWITGMVQGMEKTAPLLETMIRQTMRSMLFLAEDALSTQISQPVFAQAAPQISAPGFLPPSPRLDLDQSQTTQTFDQRTQLEINPTYKNVQSSASIYYDVQAALAAVRK